MKRFLIAIALVFALGTFQMATGDVTWNGDTTGMPTMNRPSGPSTLSATGTAVLFFLQPFYVDLTGEYIFEIDSTAPLTHTDQYAFVYANAFNAMNPLANLIAGDDDFVGTFSILSGATVSAVDGSRLALGDATNFGGAATGLLLTAGTQYFAIVTGFGNADVGTFRAAIGDGAGGGTVTLGAIPEPTTLALLACCSLLGMGRRHRK